MMFFSLDQMECGLGDNGVVLCPWRISFKADGTYTWTFSDTGDSGPYTCNGTTVTGLRSFGGAGTITGSYDAVSGQLTWDGVVYIPAVTFGARAYPSMPLLPASPLTHQETPP